MDSQTPTIEREPQSRRLDASAIQRIGRPKERQHQPKPIVVVLALQNFILTRRRNAPLVMAGEVSQPAPLAAGEWEIDGVANEPGAFLGMGFIVNRAAHIMNDGGHSKQAKVGVVQVVK